MVLSSSNKSAVYVGDYEQTDRTVDTRPTGRYSSLMKQTTSKLRDMLLDATETVVARQGIANLTLEPSPPRRA